MPEATLKTPRKKTPKQVAVIDRDSCTGCEACIEICPVDCIQLEQIGLGVKGTEAWCTIDLQRCIGARACQMIGPQRGDGTKFKGHVANVAAGICGQVDIKPRKVTRPKLSFGFLRDQAGKFNTIRAQRHRHVRKTFPVGAFGYGKNIWVFREKVQADPCWSRFI